MSWHIPGALIPTFEDNEGDDAGTGDIAVGLAMTLDRPSLDGWMGGWVKPW